MKQIVAVIFLLAAAALWAQDADEPAPEETTETPEETEDEIADLDDLDELYPVEDEDEFIPSEDVAFGQSIPFPTDI